MRNLPRSHHTLYELGTVRSASLLQYLNLFQALSRQQSLALSTSSPEPTPSPLSISSQHRPIAIEHHPHLHLASGLSARMQAIGALQAAGDEGIDEEDEGVEMIQASGWRMPGQDDQAMHRHHHRFLRDSSVEAIHRVQLFIQEMSGEGVKACIDLLTLHLTRAILSSHTSLSARPATSSIPLHILSSSKSFPRLIPQFFLIADLFDDGSKREEGVTCPTEIPLESLEHHLWHAEMRGEDSGSYNPRRHSRWDIASDHWPAFFPTHPLSLLLLLHYRLTG